MTKYISMMMVFAMLLSLLAGCGKQATEPAATEAAPAGPANALEILTNVWNLYGEEEKFSVYGGNPKENYEDNVWDAPGNYDLADENISFNLLIPADQIANVDDVASMTHGMMANNFNTAVCHVTGDVKSFAEAYYQSVSGNMWMCGMPDRVVIATIGQYVVMAYGVNDALNPFEAHLLQAYPDAQVMYNESLV